MTRPGSPGCSRLGYNLPWFQAMKWFSRITGHRPPRKRSHAYLSERPHWRVEDMDFSRFFGALPRVVPEGSMLYIENTQFARDVNDYLVPRAVQAPQHAVKAGTIWPKPRFFHVPVTRPVMHGLAELAERHAAPEVADHMVVYRDSTILIEWYDAGFDPIFLSREIDENTVREFGVQIGAKYEEPS
jgi:hypothetical protein